MKTLILGGVRSGKSRLAQDIAIKSNKPVIYIATATSNDEEMQVRIEQHKSSRPNNWLVIEEPMQLASTLAKYNQRNSLIIIDCLTLWLTNLLLDDDVQTLDRERTALFEALQDNANEIILISNETGLGIMPLGELTRRFGDEAGITNQLLASLCDRVILTVAGLPLTLKGTAYEL